MTDESGAVLPGVTVTATQTDTGLSRSVVTDGSGAWVMPNLPTGPYRLEVALQGFRTYVQTGIVLQVGATPTINAELAVGNLEETVSVEAAAPLVDVRSAGISAVVEQERIVELPLQGREITDLIVLAGSAFQPGRPNNKGFQGGVSITVAGSMLAGVAYSLDGAMHNDVQNDGGLPLPFPDAMQEFRVATSGLSAQNGMHAGAAVNAVTKSGTNILSGNAFEFLRDRRFNATKPFAAVGPDGKRLDDGLRRNQYGGTVGGPIVRDRLFFFAGYQGTKVRVNPTDNIAYVPTAAMLAGDFTAFASPACNSGRQIALRAPFVNNRVDPALFSRVALNLTAKLPKTDNPCGETKFGLPEHRDQWQTVARSDYQLSPNNSDFGRYMATKHNELSSYFLSEGNALAAANPNIDNLAQSLTLGHTGVTGSNMVNALRCSYENPADLDYDRGHCDWDQTHLANFTVGYLSPALSGGVLRVLASNWQLSGIVSARSGDWLIVSTGVTGFNGLASRVDQVSDDVYGEKSLNSYLNRAAFAQPTPGVFGNLPRNSIKGPGAWKADLAVSRLFGLGGVRKIEARVETFNLFNTFNWGNPITNLSQGNFGRIQSMAGDPRILQFGIKYGF